MREFHVKTGTIITDKEYEFFIILLETDVNPGFLS